MITIISPEQFVTVPWKNGKGVTTELAISEGGTLTDFDWRLSMASVVEDGPFSDFSGYWRNLVLIEGQGISLQHDSDKTDHLHAILDVASFDGGCKTVGQLMSGSIIDFNIMTKDTTYSAKVSTYKNEQVVPLPKVDLAFVYCLTGEASVQNNLAAEATVLPAGHLLRISPCADQLYGVRGQQMIVISLNKR